MSILEGSSSGSVLYSETHAETTNDFGIINLKIGDGNNPSTDFATINWGSDKKFLKIEMDESGGSSYTNLGTVQLLSVPYALFANEADSARISNMTYYTDSARVAGMANSADLASISNRAYLADSALVANFAYNADVLGSQGVYTTKTDTLFVVKDHDGNIVFAVYPDGAQVYVNETAKGKVGGFAISGRSPSKGS